MRKSTVALPDLRLRGAPTNADDRPPLHLPPEIDMDAMIVASDLNRGYPKYRSNPRSATIGTMRQSSNSTSSA
jgi:hypothetical protein